MRHQQFDHGRFAAANVLGRAALILNRISKGSCKKCVLLPSRPGEFDRIIGSIAFIAAPRIGFTVIADPDDPDRRLFLHVKNNISRAPQGLALRIEQRIVGFDEKGDFVASCIAWEGEIVEKTADEALRADGKNE
jgi:hypothetical protein